MPLLGSDTTVTVDPPETPTVTVEPPVAAEVIVVPSPGLPGPAGPGGAGAFYSHVQATPAATWTIPHPLGRRPFAVQVTVGTQKVIVDVDMPDTATVVITFAAPATGRVDLL